MWRRASSKLSSLRSLARPNRIITSTPSPLTLRPSATIVTRHFSGNVSKKVEDVMPIATGHEREELEAELQGRDILDINFPEGPFGTKASI
ncbi:putative cytochrome c oxidase, subunit Vb [Helianthus anomalus]